MISKSYIYSIMPLIRAGAYIGPAKGETNQTAVLFYLKPAEWKNVSKIFSKSKISSYSQSFFSTSSENYFKTISENALQGGHRVKFHSGYMSCLAGLGCKVRATEGQNLSLWIELGFHSDPKGQV